jgi:hypothetical protein
MSLLNFGLSKRLTGVGDVIDRERLDLEDDEL